MNGCRRLPEISIRCGVGCTLEEGTSHRSETPSIARCSLWSSRLVLEHQNYLGELLVWAIGAEGRRRPTVVLLFGVALKPAPLLLMELPLPLVSSQDLHLLGCQKPG